MALVEQLLHYKMLHEMLNKRFTNIKNIEYINILLVFLSPPVRIRWAHMHRILSVCLYVCD